MGDDAKTVYEKKLSQLKEFQAALVAAEKLFDKVKKYERAVTNDLGEGMQDVEAALVALFTELRYEIGGVEAGIENCPE